jgi:hypothetical protein
LRTITFVPHLCRNTPMMISERRRIIIYSIFVGLSFDLLWQSLWWLYKRFHRDALADGRQYSAKAIFFPDSEVSCRNHFTQRHGCTSQRCRFSHNPGNAYAQLMKLVFGNVNARLYYMEVVYKYRVGPIGTRSTHF